MKVNIAAWMTKLTRRQPRELSSPSRRRPGGRRRAWPPRLERGTGGFVALLGALVWAVATLTIVWQRPHPPQNFVSGQEAGQDIYSQVPFEYTDNAQTEELRQQARRRVPPVYQVDPARLDAPVQFLTDLQQALAAPTPATGDETAAAPPSLKTRVQAAVKELEKRGGAAALGKLFEQPEELQQLHTQVRRASARGLADEDGVATFLEGTTAADRVVVRDAQGRRIEAVAGEIARPSQAAKSTAAEFVQRFPADGGRRGPALETVLAAAFQPNLVYDAQETAQMRDQAAAQVPVVKEFVDAQVRLLRRGDRISGEDLARLNTHARELQRQRGEENRTRDVLVTLGLTLVLVIMGAGGLMLLRAPSLQSRSALVLVTVVTILQALVSRSAADLYHGYQASSVLFASLVPMALGSLLLAQLVGPAPAVWVGVFTSLLTAMQNNMSVHLFLVGASASFAGAVLARMARRRLDVLRVGLGIGLVVLVMQILFVVSNDMPLDLLPRLGAAALLSGVATSAVAFAVLPLFEHVFGLTTEFSLLELSDLNHPLLQRLQMEAPGTYHHSLLVATLAEQAAAAINANPLLARVCAYFHDIGKLAQPEYFAENIATPEDTPHDSLRPRLSALVILNHVKEGLELAGQYRLRRIIRDAIAQHHGTSLVYYFYRRALERNADTTTPPAESDYRYPGPLPARREIVLVGLADACEAAATSLEKPTPAKIESLVNDIVQNRLLDGQLDHADLTFHELSVARETLARSLSTMRHARVAYPKPNEDHEDRVPKPQPASPAAPAG